MKINLEIEKQKNDKFSTNREIKTFVIPFGCVGYRTKFNSPKNTHNVYKRELHITSFS